MTPSPFLPAGTVYGVLLNSQDEQDALRAQMTQPPYKAAPQAPVLYVKTANTWSTSGSAVPVPARLDAVECGGTVGLVIGRSAKNVSPAQALSHVAGYVLMNDLSVPHASFFRPPVKFKNLDGFLGIGAQLASPQDAGDPARWQLQVHIDGQLQQAVDFAQLVRPAAQLLADVSSFMTLHAGDVLMLGCGAGRPLARVGQRIDIQVAGVPALGILSNTLVAETASKAGAAA